MTYQTGLPILAADYNGLATNVGTGIQEVYLDLHPGSVPTVPGTFNPADPCTFGYGQLSPVLTPVAIGYSVNASDWRALFEVMRICGVHTGESAPGDGRPPISPPLPTDPNYPQPGWSVIAIPPAIPGAGSIPDVVARLRDRRFFNRDPVTWNGTAFYQPANVGPWQSSITWTGHVDFGAGVAGWNMARHFFNTGGYLDFSFPSGELVATSSDDEAWILAIVNTGPIRINFHSSEVAGITPIMIGFYDFTTEYRILFSETGSMIGGGYTYDNIKIEVRGKLNAAAGTSGVVDIQISLIDTSASPVLKNFKWVIGNAALATKAPVTYSGQLPLHIVVDTNNNGFVAN